MNESQRLAAELQRALRGEAWHGPSWREILDGVGRAAALHRPIAGAHCIAEIVLHISTWHDVVRRRLDGENPAVTPAQDWPPASFADEKAWRAEVARLFETGSALQDTIARFPEEHLHDTRPGSDETWYQLAIGALQHDLYHAGQVGLLRKAQVPAAA